MEHEESEPMGELSTGVQPQTARGHRTREALIAAARVVFERDGYVDARLVDIAQEAKCSIGSFYTWFEGKDEVFAAVMEQTKKDMLYPGTGRIDDDPIATIEAANRAYFEAYKRNGRLNLLMDQVVAVDPRFRRLRRQRSEAFVERNARAIRDLQARGLADRQLDPDAASAALSGMVSRLIHDQVRYELGGSMELLVQTATRLWTNALGLTAPDLGGSGVEEAEG
ncbi:TetR/AcrR family transcriptional regulator [Propioniferax innocua]|uniref:TetR family transcriptional regulator n=1 Tax=Propioniferax innocua TaxID=1753 RepID=A0A542ZDR2_9ACTN|nr:TetR/AcrR family transcriptional regulator [Propioniferax innocua]TQL58409.1 TetR family transcriptional regulator [Propioniferax innocua]